MSTNTISYRVQDVLTYIKRQFGDESGVQITDQDILAWINMAQVDIANTAKCIQGKAATNVVAGIFEYDLPLNDAVEIITLRYKGAPLTSVEFAQAEQDLIREDPTRKSTGRPQWWTKFGSSIQVWPTPDESVADGITVFYYGVPAQVTNPAAMLGLPDRYYSAILSYVLAQAYGQDEDMEMKTTEYQSFLNKIGDSSNEDDQAANLFFPTITFTDME